MTAQLIEDKFSVTFQTSNGSQTAAHSIALAANSIVQVDATILAIESTFAAKAAGYRRIATFGNSGGDTQINGVSTPATHEADSTMDATMNLSGGNIRILVTGLAGTTINWWISGTLKRYTP